MYFLLFLRNSVFHNVSIKRKKENKILEHSKYYFTHSDTTHYGLISIIYTLGRNLKWNPIFIPLFHWVNSLKTLSSKKLDNSTLTLLPNTRLRTLLRTRSLSFWLMIKRKLTLIHLSRDSFLIF